MSEREELAEVTDSISPPLKRPAQSSVVSLKRARKKPKLQKPSSPAQTLPVFPRFELQSNRKNAPMLGELRNLALWMLTLEHGSTPQWIFTPVFTIQNKHEVGQIIILFLPGLDALTLRDNQENIPFLHSFLSKNKHFTLLRNRNDGSYLRQIIENYKDLSKEIDCFATIPPLCDPNTAFSEYEKYILTEDQLVENQFPMSIEAEPEFVETGPGEVQGDMQVIAIDCEMVRTETALELARVSLVNLTGDIIYDAFVKPGKPVVDYLTQYSGITEKTLEDIQLTLDQARNEVLSRVKRDTIVCGHSLENDLRALKLIHKRVIDTSVIYPHNAPARKWSLKNLAQRYLRKSIQNVTFRQQKGHDSIEDARAALFLVREKVKYGAKFGIPHPNRVVENLFEVLGRYGRKSALVGLTPERDLVQGNVNVDLSGRVEKYLGADSHLVLTEWRELIGTANPDSVLKQWNERIQALVTASPQNTGWVIATGEGDACEYNQLLSLKTEGSWTFQQEQSLHLAEARLKKTFGVFFFPGQL